MTDSSGESVPPPGWTANSAQAANTRLAHGAEVIAPARRARQGRSAVAAAAVVVLVAAVASITVLTRGSGGAPSSGLTGSELLARARHTYTRVPAVLTTVVLGSLTLRFTSILNAGEVVAEAFVGTSGSETTMLVSRQRGVTYARQPGSSCWRLLAPSDPQTLTDIGERIPPFPANAVAGPPRQTAGGWLVDVQADGYKSSFEIDRDTYLVPTIRVRNRTRVASEGIHALASAPSLPVPTPTC